MHFMGRGCQNFRTPTDMAVNICTSCTQLRKWNARLAVELLCSSAACRIGSCQAFSQYRSLNTKSRKSKRYGHLRRQPPLEPSHLSDFFRSCTAVYKRAPTEVWMPLRRGLSQVAALQAWTIAGDQRSHFGGQLFRFIVGSAEMSRQQVMGLTILPMASEVKLAHGDLPVRGTSDPVQQCHSTTTTKYEHASSVLCLMQQAVMAKRFYSKCRFSNT